MADAIVREWLRRTIGDGAMTAGIGEEIRSFPAAFYADDGLIQLRDPVRLQALLDTIVSLFERFGLRTNTSKTETMVCVLGRIRTCQSQAMYNKRKEDHAEAKRWKGRRVECNICGEELAASLLRSHLETQHDVHSSIVLSPDLGDKGQAPVLYLSSISFLTGQYPCPFPDCAGKASESTGCAGALHTCTRRI